MHPQIETIEQAEEFIKNLKRSNNNWVSDERMLHQLEDCRTLIEKYQRDDLLPYFGVNACLYFIDNGDYGPALEHVELAEKYAEKFSNYECLLNALSLQYRVQRYIGNLENAQIIVNRQIDTALQYKDPHLIASAYHNQGALSHRLGLKADCIEAYEKSIEYIKKSGLTYYDSMFQIGYSGVLLDFGLPEMAEKYLEEGYSIALKNSYIHQQALAKSNFGFLYQLQNKEDLSVQAFNECITLFKNLNNVSDMFMGKIMLADALVHFKRTEEAEQILKGAIEFSENNKLKYNQIGIYEALSKLYEQNGNYKDSLHYLKQLIKVKEEYLSAESEKRISNLEVTQKVKILKMEKATAEQLAHVKHDFLANMSHEIRTPINSILGICYLLQQRELDEISINYINRLHRSGENLLGIINDVLDISKIESGKMELDIQPFSLNTILQDIFNSNEPRALEKHLNFSIIRKYKDEIILNGDFIRLQQVLTNLISNALKFTEKGSVILYVTPIELSNNRIEIQFIVTDTGIGVPKDKIDKIFERYEQASARIKTTYGGTGLGLSISRKIIELMNGSIEIKSKQGKGSEFKVAIPFQLANQTIQKENVEMINSVLLNTKRIIIADDDMENRLVAKDILMKFNDTITIIEAENGKEVLDLLKTTSVDILFIDMDMPVLNGIETVQEIRKNKKYNSIKIIGNTASLSTFSEDELSELGFNDFIYKPYKPEDFISKMIILNK